MCKVTATVLVVLLLAFTVSGCARDPGRTWLDSQPEYGLTYPGATLVSTDTGGDGGLYRPHPYTEWQFTSSAGLADIHDWYSAQLSPRHWVGGQDATTVMEGKTFGKMYDWQRPGLSLSLSGYPAIAGQTHFRVWLGVEGEWQWASQLQSLRDLPEAQLAPPKAKPTASETFSASLMQGGTRLSVQRQYEWSSSQATALQFYDSSLVALGWTRVKPATSEPLDNASDITWQKGQVLAVVKVNSGSIVFTLTEWLDPQGSPIPAPSAS
jgi:hypothetical protein